MRVLVTGGTGFIGRPLVEALRKRGDEVRVLARDAIEARAQLGVDAIAWDAAKPVPPDAMAGVDGVVNLAGAGIADKRWTPARKELLRRSRIDGTRAVVEAIGSADPRPRVLVSGSAVGYYGNVPDAKVTEAREAGDDFLARLCVEWEREARASLSHGLRVVLVRTGVVLGPGGGALAKMLPVFKLGAGGPIGDGKQWVSWVHLDDAVGLILHALDTEAVAGPMNATAPEPVRNRELARELGRALRRPAVIPVPGPALKLLLGEMAGAALLAGQRVLPAKATETGYHFRFQRLVPALRDAIR